MIGEIVHTTLGRIGRIIQIDNGQPQHYLIDFGGYQQWILADVCLPYIDLPKEHAA